MGTRASIKITDGSEIFFVYCGHDGFPDNIEPDLARICDVMNKERFAEAGLATTFFLMCNSKKDRLPFYEITSGVHGDEENFFYLWYNKVSEEWYYQREGEGRK